MENSFTCAAGTKPLNTKRAPVLGSYSEYPHSINYLQDRGSRTLFDRRITKNAMEQSVVKVIDHGRFLTLLILTASTIVMVLSFQIESRSVPQFLTLVYVLTYFLSLIGTGFWILTCSVMYKSIKVFRSAGVNVSWLWVILSVLGTPLIAIFSVWLFVANQRRALHGRDVSW